MTAIATPDHLGFLFVLVCLIVFFGATIYLAVARPFGRFMGTNSHRADRQFESHGRERLGTSPVADLAAEQERKASRGRFRHATRFGKDVA